MVKRKQPEPDSEPESSLEPSEAPSKRRRTRIMDAAHTNGVHNGDHEQEHNDDGDATMADESTPKKPKTPAKTKRKSAAEALLDEEEQGLGDEGSPTPKANGTGRTLFSTPRRGRGRPRKDGLTSQTPTKPTTPSKAKASASDRSAKRKSARALVEAQAQAQEQEEDEEEDWDGQIALAKKILATGDEENETTTAGNYDRDAMVDETTVEPDDAAAPTTTTTPTKPPGKRGRPKGAKNKRSPTPEGDIAPEERYFFQNRAGPPQISNNKFNSVKLLSHDEYFEQIQTLTQKDRHEKDREQLMKLHARSFAQWSFELHQGFSLCLYGYGSKRGLTTKFAEWLYRHLQQKQKLRKKAYQRESGEALEEDDEVLRAPRIIVINGYTPKLNVRGILNTIAAAVTTSDSELYSDGDGDGGSGDEERDRDSDEEDHHHHHHHPQQSQSRQKRRRRRLRLIGQPHEMLDTLLTYLDTEHSSNSGKTTAADDRDGHDIYGGRDPEIVVLVNSIDAPPLRRLGTQSLLARLAAHRSVKFIATADTPTFATLWSSTLLDQFRFVYHDCTTFAPYTAEISVVDEVHELLGRKRMRSGGKEGIGFVLKSLPENARNLYRLLICEILASLGDDELGGGAGADRLNDDGDDDDGRSTTKQRPRSAKQQAESGSGSDQVGVEYRTLYQKASEEFICSSSMNFQFLLKEFHDHQMITSRRDQSGTEVLGVPLDKQEMEAVLEELVI
ncbi:hypothetical protein ABEF95_010354 [Exophiala dermatitidis]